MKPLTLSGKDLHSQMIRNGKSLSRSAKELGISVEELQAYFEYETIEEDMLFDILKKLNILIVIDAEPYEITPLAIERFGVYEERIKLLKIIINDFIVFVNQTGNIAEEYNRCTIKIIDCIKDRIEKPESYQNPNLIDFDKVKEDLKRINEGVKNSVASFNERFKGFKD